MRQAVTLLAVVAFVAVPGCAAVESVFKPAPPPPGSTGSAPSSPTSTPPSPRARPAPLPPLQPQLSEADERRLRDQATRQIGDAERAVQAIRTEALQPEEREGYASIQSFLRQARQALAARDYERAATLSRKAEALAKDLPQSSR